MTEPTSSAAVGTLPDQAGRWADVLVWLRSAAFNFAFYVLTAGMIVAAMPLLLAPRRLTMAAMRLWAMLVTVLLHRICGIRLRLLGGDRLPRPGQAGLIAAKHQSAFDTIVWLAVLPDAAYVLKQDLLRIPLYGQFARKARMIAVDRAAGASALRHLVREGREAALAARQIVIFPEGTRVAPGRRRPYQPGVAALAAATGLPVMPAATDSGRCWGRRAFRKSPGVITLSVLPALPAGLGRETLLQQLEAAIEAESQRLLLECRSGG
jgi:1-acyl-sn-glycerol-3-phosphate acyltransferase